MKTSRGRIFRGAVSRARFTTPCIITSIVAGSVWLVACSGDDATTANTAGTGGGASGSGSSTPPTDPDVVSSDPNAASADAPTYYRDVLPVFAQKCVGCHQEGGIAPFALDDYEAARARGTQIADYTENRVMPPYGIQPGGACGSFDESRMLTPDQIALIGAWGRGDRAEGTPASVALPPLPALDGATDFALPNFTPQVDGSEIALFDEYRCFLVDPNATELAFVTGYDVLPGAPAIVHHVLAFIVDPNAPSRDGRSNAEVMQALHDTDPNPEREGWSCFGAAGEGVDVESSPVAWGPGQGVIEYPGNIGVPLAPGRQIVVQVHYNLADASNIGLSDQTRLRLRLQPSVPRAAAFALEDPLLDSLYDGQPTTLEPGQSSVKYVWERSGADIGVPPGAELGLVAIMPHMHALGHKYTFEVDNGNGYECQGQIDRWDFNWQHMYQYTQPLTFNANTRVRVTCDFDTLGATEPVTPGWGTRNEMCLATMMLALPGAQ